MYITYANKYSPTGRRLRASLGALKIRLGGNPWRPKKTRQRPVLVVWAGRLDREVPRNARIIQNPPPLNKLSQLRRLQENLPEHCPEFTTDKDQANVWRSRSKVLARQRLDGHSGQGIEEFNGQDAPLYVRYYPKDTEVRVHVFDGRVFLISQKRRRNGHDGNPIIRNHSNGYIYSAKLSNYLAIPEIQRIAERAVNAVGYRWGAVDIICRRDRNPQYLVLEVNAAPGLEGRTLDAYSQQFRSVAPE